MRETSRGFNLLVLLLLALAGCGPDKQAETCSLCRGTGQVMGQTCAACKGRGSFDRLVPSGGGSKGIDMGKFVMGIGLLGLFALLAKTLYGKSNPK